MRRWALGVVHGGVVIMIWLGPVLVKGFTCRCYTSGSLPRPSDSRLQYCQSPSFANSDSVPAIGVSFAAN